MQRGGIGGGFDLLAQGAIAEQFGDFRQNFKVFLGGRFRHQQEDQQGDRLLVRRVKTDRCVQLENGGHRRFEPLDAAMRNGNAMTEPGRAQTFAGEQTVSDQRAVHPVQVFKQQAGFFESTLFAGRFNADQNLSGGQNLRKTVHRGRQVGKLCTFSRVCTTHAHKKAAWCGRLASKRPIVRPRLTLLLREDLLLSLGRDVVMVLDFGFVPRHLAVQLVGQFIDGGIQIGV